MYVRIGIGSHLANCFNPDIKSDIAVICKEDLHVLSRFLMLA